MPNLIIVDDPAQWRFDVPGVEVVSARSYLTDEEFARRKASRVFNLCRSYRYLSEGYYVSLLAEARRHRPLPSLMTIQDMKSQSITRLVSDELDELFQKSLAHLQSKEFTLSIYFGHNVAQHYEKLSMNLFSLFQAPLLRAFFRRNGKWELHRMTAISTGEIPDGHRDFVQDVARQYFAGKRQHLPRRSTPRYHLAILTDPHETEAPSNEKALQKFVKAAEQLDMSADFITREDYARLAEYDALFIRETTSVNHHTYRFARRADAEGLVVIDDPESILRCTNKVYLEELLRRKNIPTPHTLIVHSDNVGDVEAEVGFPCILKQPDGAFSSGVIKVENADELNKTARHMLDKSELIIAQEFLPTSFDWRIGILDRRAVYACRYHMAPRHWQIIKSSGDSDRERYGRVTAVPVELAPRRVVKTALDAANLIGDGLYGVDVKQVDKKAYVIEVNDNPNIDAGYEDSVLKDDLYMRIMEIFVKRIEQKRRGE